MATPVITLSTENNAIDAFEIMAKNNVGCLVVTKNIHIRGNYQLQ